MTQLTTSPSNTQLIDTLRVLARHRTKAALAFVVVAATTVITVMVWPERFASDAKVFIRIGSTVKIDPSASLGTFVSPNESREREIISVLEILKSRDLLDRVVEQVGAHTILPPKSLSYGNSTNQLPSGKASDSLVMERAVGHLASSIDCEAPNHSNVITITSTSHTSELAQRILQAYLDAYFDHNLKMNRDSHSFDFFTRQSEDLKNQLLAAKQELRDAKNKVGLVSIDGQRRMLEAQITNLQTEILDTQTAIASNSAKLAGMRQMYPHLDEAMLDELTSGVSSAATDNMRGEWYKLQLQQRELNANLSPQHPRVIAIEQQVREAQLLVAQQEFLVAKSRALELAAKSVELSTRYDEAQQNLVELNEHEVRITELERHVTQLSGNHKTYTEKLEQARIEKALDDERISNIEIAQAPSLIAEPVSPNKPAIILIGFIFAAMVACGLAFAIEFVQASLAASKETADVELPAESPPASPKESFATSS